MARCVHVTMAVLAVVAALALFVAVRWRVGEGWGNQVPPNEVQGPLYDTCMHNPFEKDIVDRMYKKNVKAWAKYDGNLLKKNCKMAQESAVARWNGVPSKEEVWKKMCGAATLCKDPNLKYIKHCSNPGNGYSCCTGGGECETSMRGKELEATWDLRTLPNSQAGVQWNGCTYYTASHRKDGTWACFPDDTSKVGTGLGWHNGTDWGRYQCTSSEECKAKVIHETKEGKRDL